MPSGTSKMRDMTSPTRMPPRARPRIRSDVHPDRHPCSVKRSIRRLYPSQVIHRWLSSLVGALMVAGSPENTKRPPTGVAGGGLSMITRAAPGLQRASSMASALERVAQHNGFVAVGARGNQVDGNAAQLGDPLEVAAGSGGQLGVFGDADSGLAPARQFFEHRLGLRDGMGAVRQHVAEFAIDAVTHAKLDGFQAVEHVELGDAQAGNAVQAHRALERCAVEPAAATGTPRDRAEFLADGGQTRADFVYQFGGERTGTHPG